MTTPRLIGAAVLLLALWFGWQWLFPDDQSQIRAVFARISAIVEASASAETGSGGIEGLARVASLQQEFAPDATVDAGAPLQRLKGRQPIVAAAARVLLAARDLELRFPDITIDVAGDRQTATAIVTAEAYFDQAGQRTMDARELELTFMRVEDRWVIGAVSLIQPLERLDK